MFIHLGQRRNVHLSHILTKFSSSVIFLFITVKLLWNYLYCIKPFFSPFHLTSFYIWVTVMSRPPFRCWECHTWHKSAYSNTTSAYISGCVFMVCVCSLLCVCTWMGWMQSTNSEYGSPYLATCHFHFHFHFKTIQSCHHWSTMGCVWMARG